MKQHSGLLWLLACVLAIVGAAFGTWAILASAFSPAAICAGEETYGLAEQFQSSWRVSVLDQDGTRLGDCSFPADSADRAPAVCFADGVYYFSTDQQTEQEQLRTVYRVSAASGKALSGNIQLRTEKTEQLCAVQSRGGTLSVVGWHRAGAETVLTVYLAGTDASMFFSERTFPLPGEYLPRDAFYLENGSVVFLTAAGRVYTVTETQPEPVLLYDGSDQPAAGLCLDGFGQICLFDCGGKALRLTETGKAEPYLEAFCSQLSYSGGSTLSNCTSFSFLSEACGAVLFQEETGTVCAGLYRNGVWTQLDTLFRGAWWSAALLFLGLTILLGALLYLLIYGIRTFFCGSMTMQSRAALFCGAAAVLVLSAVSVYTYSAYQQQEESLEQERLRILLNNAEIYLQPEQQTDPEQLLTLDWDTPRTDSWVQRLEAFSQGGGQDDSTCLLLVRSGENTFTAVSGCPDQNGMTVEQICSRETAQQFAQASGSAVFLSGVFQREGVRWRYLAKPVSERAEIPEAFLLILMPAGQTDHLQIFLANLLLGAAMAGFLLLLLLRIRVVLRPLRQMEEQAEKFLVSGSCDPIPLRGQNEITVLTIRFQKAVNELRSSMEKSRRSAESYGRFADPGWLTLLHKENLSAVRSGDQAEHVLAVLELKLVLPDGKTPGETEQYQALYAKVLPVVQKNKGIPEDLSPERMRFLFPGGCFDAVCAASMIREAAGNQAVSEAVIDCGRTTVFVCGDDAHIRFCSFMEEESVHMPLLHQICREFGCGILVTGQALETIPDYRQIFPCRTVGFFAPDSDSRTTHLVEILPQRTSSVFEQAVRLWQVGEYREAFRLFSAVLETNPADQAALRYLRLCDETLRRKG